MQAISRYSDAILIAAILLGVILFVWGLWTYLITRLTQFMLAGAPRPHYSAFEFRLRDLVFLNPAAFMDRLWTDDHATFVKGLWNETGSMISQRNIPAGLSSDNMEVYRTRISDGRCVVVITMPGSQQVSEPYLIGVVLPANEEIKRDLVAARNAVPFFVLSGYHLGRDTDLYEWTIAKKKITYNIGAPRDPKGSAGVIGAKLTEMRR
jgi:hypothetical protein